MARTERTLPKLAPAKPRARKAGRPAKDPAKIKLVLCAFCRTNPAVWQRPVRMQDGELLVHCDSSACDQAYMKLVFKTRYPFTQNGNLAGATHLKRGRAANSNRTSHLNTLPSTNGKKKPDRKGADA